MIFEMNELKLTTLINQTQKKLKLLQVIFLIKVELYQIFLKEFLVLLLQKEAVLIKQIKRPKPQPQLLLPKKEKII
jgi:hypothetical protein